MEKKIIPGEDIILLVDEKTTLHATTHSLKVDLELKVDIPIKLTPIRRGKLTPQS